MWESQLPRVSGRRAPCGACNVQFATTRVWPALHMPNTDHRRCCGVVLACEIRRSKFSRAGIRS